MKIIAAEVVPFRLPLRGGLRGAGSVREGLILRLRSDDGVSGFGEASPATWVGGERLDEVSDALETFVGAVLADADIEVLERLSAELPSAARGAVDTALLDVAARTANRSVASFLRDSVGDRVTSPLRGEVARSTGEGETPRQAAISPPHPGPLPKGRGKPESEAGSAGELTSPRWGTSLMVAVLLVAEEPAALVAEATTRARGGYRCLKVKVGGRSLDADRERVAAVREAVGGDVSLRLDANQGWSLDEARRALDALRRFAPELVEEPLRGAAPEALAGLRRSFGVPLALDESVSTAEDLERFLRAGAADALVLKAARCGGLRPALALGRRAAAGGLRVVVTDSIESAVGRAAALHLAAAVGTTAAVGLGGAILLGDDVVAEPDDRGRPLVAPRGPGLGVTPDPKPKIPTADERE